MIRCGLSLFLYAALATVAVKGASEVKDPFHIGTRVLEKWQTVISQAQEEILIATYKLTAPDALNALIEAHKRGVVVKLILDEKAARKAESLATEAESSGLDVVFWPTKERGKLHVKLTIVDRQQAMFGSFNLTESAEKHNVELFYLTSNETVVEQAVEQWDALSRQSFHIKR